MIHRSILGLIWILLVLFSLPTLGQESLQSVNSGGLSSDDFSFSFGEIFVVEIIEEEEKLYTVDASMFPNPTTGLSFLKTEWVLENKWIEIYNMFGQQVIRLEVTNNQINCSELSSGIYILKSTSNEFNPIKFIKK